MKEMLGKKEAQPNIIEKFGRERLEEIQECIAKATGLAFVTVDYTGNPVTETTSFSSFCNRARNSEESCELCKKSDAFGALQAAISRKPCIYFCPCGLLEVAIPMEDHGAFLGGFIGGQVRCVDAPEDIIHLSSLLQSKSSKEFLADFQEEKEKNPLYSYAHFQDVVNLIALILHQLDGNQGDGISEAEKEQLRQCQEEKMELKTQVEELERKISKMMLSQNPYLIGNMLSSISGMTLLEGAEESNELLLTMANYFRNSAKFREEQWTLEDEIDLVEQYIKLSSLKYGEQFHYSIQMPKNLNTRQIPIFSILAYVEDAIYYGISCKNQEGILEIHLASEGDDCLVTIQENGPGYSEEELQELFKEFKHEHEGYYIKKAEYYISKRFCKEYGEEYRPRIQTEKGKGRTIQIRIPEIH